MNTSGAYKMSSQMGCFECGQLYHLPCFNMRHHYHLNTGAFNSLMNAAIDSYEGKDNAKFVTLCGILDLWVAQGVAS